MTALVTMSRRELDRASVLAQLAEGRVSQVQAAELLGLGVRQVRRLSRAYAADGPAALASKRRGRRSNRALADDVREAAIALVRRATPTSARRSHTRSSSSCTASR